MPPPPPPEPPSPVAAARGGALAAAVAAVPALALTAVNGLVALCLSCVGVAPAVAAAGAGSVGVSAGGVTGGVLVLLGVAAMQVRRLRRCYPAGPARRRAATTQVLTLVVVAGLSFAAVQWLLLPLLAPSTAGGSVPVLAG